MRVMSGFWLCLTSTNLPNMFRMIPSKLEVSWSFRNGEISRIMDFKISLGWVVSELESLLCSKYYYEARLITLFMNRRSTLMRDFGKNGAKNYSILASLLPISLASVSPSMYNSASVTDSMSGLTRLTTLMFSVTERGRGSGILLLELEVKKKAKFVEILTLDS